MSDRGPGRPRLAYLAPDLSDPAVGRRVEMLQAGGADVTPVGFRRNPGRIREVKGAAAVDLGRTQDLRLGRRMASVAKAALLAPLLARRIGRVDRLVTRNLEMLALGRVLQAFLPGRPKLAYEVLDVHRLMLGEGRASRLLRGVEQALADPVDLLLVSSPAFVSGYFDVRWRRVPPVRLVENKVLALPPADRQRQPAREGGRPWRIGWFGMLRCQRSLDILCRLAATGQVQVTIRGRPSLQVFTDFFGQVSAAPGVDYAGLYKPEDLPSHYADVHFAWAIDFYEEGLNSAWLLPNRLYEGSFFGATPIALSSVETGRWLQRFGAGLLLGGGDVEGEGSRILLGLTEQDRQALAAAVERIPTTALACGRTECEDLVRALVA